MTLTSSGSWVLCSTPPQALWSAGLRLSTAPVLWFIRAGFRRLINDTCWKRGKAMQCEKKGDMTLKEGVCEANVMQPLKGWRHVGNER